MRDQPVVLAVASYPSRAAAEEVFASLWASQLWAGHHQLAAALVEKGSSGELEMDNHRCAASRIGSGVALLGGALTAVAAPLGVALLASGLASSAEWDRAVTVVGRFWNDVPRDVLRNMSNLLEAGQAGLVIVAGDRDGHDVATCLSGATSSVLSDSTWVDVVADFPEGAGTG
jgi:hypothetical protein